MKLQLQEPNVQIPLIVFFVLGCIIMVLPQLADDIRAGGFCVAAVSFVVYGARYITGPAIDAKKRGGGNATSI